ncbi:adenosylcobinamide-GDP ribazoletransferase [Sulfitobacter sp. SK012]|nr:adenosylcobinamide-GDP ribazoletransferase [Sulfitobacter sp. SK012]
MHKAWQLHPWLAGVLLTRLPLPHLPDDAFEAAPRAVWAYPLIGAGVGAVGAIVGLLAMHLGLPDIAAAGLALAAMMLITGAMHEDGLADCCDGFWGGRDSAQRLIIMRDSQIGTYGVLGLIVVTGLRWSALVALLPYGLWPLVAAAALSRGAMPVVMAGLPHARCDGLSHSVGQPSMSVAWQAAALGAAIALLCLGPLAFSVAILAGLIALGVALLAKAKIGGQTGDVLGATQQLCEMTILLTCAAALI